MQKDFRRAIEGYDQFPGTNFAAGLPRNPNGVLNLLDNYLRLRIADGKKIALIIDFAETVAPAEFEKQMTGKKVGESLELPVTFPAEFEVRDVAGKSGVACLTVREVYRLVAPTDEEMLRELDMPDLQGARALLNEMRP